jgi:hypothetical protein
MVTMQLLSGLTRYVGTRADHLSGVEWTIGGGFLLLGMLAILFLTKELLRQAMLLLQRRREARVKSPRRRLH